MLASDLADFNRDMFELNLDLVKHNYIKGKLQNVIPKTRLRLKFFIKTD